jgi:hypothetical protein
MVSSAPLPRVAVLSIHAGYRCQDSGICCTSGWPIPVERDRLTQFETAIADRRLTGLTSGVPLWLTPAGAPADTPAVLETHDGACVFFDGDLDQHCRVQHRLGHAALPLACRQFPRVSVRDPRGVSVTLSHFCPTAASLLETPGPRDISIVSNAPGLPPEGEYVGLDATAALPPLLRPGMLTDWEGWTSWERHAVSWLATGGESPADALAILAGVVEDVRGWTPAKGPLVAAIEAAWRRAAHTDRAEHRPSRRDHSARLLRELRDAVPEALRPPMISAGIRTSPLATRRFLAAHAFANWTAYLGEGLRTWLRSIDAAYAFLDAGYGVREADRWLRHLADPHALAKIWKNVE